VSTDWSAVSQRNARSVQTTIGWIYWDPGVVARYEALGLPGNLGLIAARVAPFAGAGPDAVTSALGSISPLAVEWLYKLLPSTENFMAIWHARNDAVLEGLATHAPAMLDALPAFGPALCEVAAQLPVNGRPFCASHRALPIPDDPVLSGWHAINFLREWRGDTHWDLVTTLNLTGGEASILHNAWLGYDGDWLSLSRGNTPEAIDAAWEGLHHKGLARDRSVTAEGIALRQHLEDETDRLGALPWQLLGVNRAQEFATVFEPPCELLLRRVDETAGVRYQPASRIRTPRA
jgi:hypothetical protein